MNIEFAEKIIPKKMCHVNRYRSNNSCKAQIHTYIKKEHMNAIGNQTQRFNKQIEREHWKIIPHFRLIRVRNHSNEPMLLGNLLYSWWCSALKNIGLFIFTWIEYVHPPNNMMTSSNGNTFHDTGPLCEEITGYRWIPRKKASEPGLWCFLWSVPE